MNNIVLQCIYVSIFLTIYPIEGWSLSQLAEDEVHPGEGGHGETKTFTLRFTPFNLKSHVLCTEAVVPADNQCRHRDNKQNPPRTSDPSVTKLNPKTCTLVRPSIMPT